MPMTAGKSLARLAGFVVFGASSLSAQQLPPVTRNIALNVVAVDSQGKPVDDLTAADFQVSDQGKPQHIISFGRSATPGTSSTLARPLVLLFDLLNENFSDRGLEKEKMDHAWRNDHGQDASRRTL